ncbi:MAG TPA: amylo-alpha-1,6-glucosidase [Gammaproteobacteria bacterium]
MTEATPHHVLPAAPAGQIPVFYIPATTSIQERRPRTLKHGDTFAVFDHNGDIVDGPSSPEGLYHADTRHLSHARLTIGGQRPLLLSSTLRADNATLTCDLTNPDLFEDGRLVLEHGVIHIRRTTFLWQGACYERIRLRNHSNEPQTFTVALSFRADFADLFEVRGMVRKRRGALHPPVVQADRVVLGYTGLCGTRRVTSLQFDPAPARLRGDLAVFELTLPPQEGCTIHVEVSFADFDCKPPPARHFRRAIRDARHALRQSALRMASIDTSNEIFNEVVRRSVADLCMLVTDKPEGPVPYAGIPWFSTPFGRDALITAVETLWMDPAITRGALKFLAAHQAVRDDPAADAEPGKILHEMRQGEMAILGEVPFRHYYGSVDATPLFVAVAGAYYERTGDIDTIRSIWPNIKAALEWIDRYGDRDGDGFVEYGRRNEQGLVNQGWKDSTNSVFHADGRLAHGPIALVEVQGYVYAAKRAAAAMARALGEHGYAVALDTQAETLRVQFEEAFWDEELGIYVAALDGDKRPCRVRTSNAGHALLAGIADPERARRVAASLMSNAFFCGWGIRTVAAGEVLYNPMSYHNGSVWPHDNALIALGFARYGLKKEVVRIMDGLFAAATHMDLRRLPELFCGFARRPGRGATLYPVACTPQAWASAAPIALLQACLGLTFDPAAKIVRFERPVLPSWLQEVTLRGIQLCGQRVDVTLRRRDGEVLAGVLARTGDVRVVSVN